MTISTERRAYRYFDLVMALFVAVLLISNIASSAKIVTFGVPFLTFDGGTLLFPLSYIFGDILTEVYGYRRSRRVIWTGFFCTALMSLTLWVVGRIPGEAEWSARVGQQAYDAVLGATPRIVVASLVAYFAGEFSNSYVLAKMKLLTRGRWLWTRTIGSTIVGEGIDTLLFVTLAFAGSMSWGVLLSIFVSNYLFKTGLEVVMTPVTYQVVGFLKRAENEDYYDHDTDFNPFRIADLGGGHASWATGRMRHRPRVPPCNRADDEVGAPSRYSGSAYISVEIGQADERQHETH